MVLPAGIAVDDTPSNDAPATLGFARRVKTTGGQGKITLLINLFKNFPHQFARTFFPIPKNHKNKQSKKDTSPQQCLNSQLQGMSSCPSWVRDSAPQQRGLRGLEDRKIAMSNGESNHISVSWVMVPYLGTIFFLWKWF